MAVRSLGSCVSRFIHVHVHVQCTSFSLPVDENDLHSPKCIVRETHKSMQSDLLELQPAILHHRPPPLVEKMHDL